MERRFTEFRSAEADGTTAILAIAEDGDPVLLSRDWGTLREESEAEWERVVKALMPVAIEGVESSEDPVSVEVTEAVEQIANSGLVDATDSRVDFLPRLKSWDSSVGNPASRLPRL